MDTILDMLQQSNPNYGRHNPNGGGGNGGTNDPRRFSTGTGSTGIPGVMVSADGSETSSRMDYELEDDEGGNDEKGQMKNRKAGVEAGTGSRTLKSSELTKRLERLKDEEDVLLQRSGDHNRARRPTETSRFTVTPSLYTPDNDLSMEAIDIEFGDTDDNTTKKSNGAQNERMMDTMNSVKGDNLQRHQKAFGGNLKKYQSAPSLPPPPKHKNLKKNNETSSPTATITANEDFRRSSSVHFDESSLVKHRSQSEMIPTSPSLLQPTLTPHNRSSSFSLLSQKCEHNPQQHQYGTTTTKQTKMTRSANDIRGNAYVSDIESDEPNSSRNSTPTMEHSTATSPRLSREMANSTQQLEIENSRTRSPLKIQSLQLLSEANQINDDSSTSTKPITDATISETTFSSSSESQTTQPASGAKADFLNANRDDSSALVPPVLTRRRMSEPSNSTGQTSEFGTNSTPGNNNDANNGHLSNSTFNLQC